MAELLDNPGKEYTFAMERSRVEITYDFPDDGGVIGVLDMLTIGEKLLVERCYIKGKAAVTSSGDPTIEVGVKGGDTDALIPATLKGAMGIDSVVKEASIADGLVLQENDVLAMEIKVAALTAGKFTFVLEYSQFD